MVAQNSYCLLAKQMLTILLLGFWYNIRIFHLDSEPVDIQAFCTDYYYYYFFSIIIIIITIICYFL